jgi:hypothetical protein
MGEQDTSRTASRVVNVGKKLEEGYKSREASRTASRYAVEANSVPREFRRARKGIHLAGEYTRTHANGERVHAGAPVMIPEDIFSLSLSLSLSLCLSFLFTLREIFIGGEPPRSPARLSISDAPRNNATNVASPCPCVADSARGRGRTNPISLTSVSGDPVSRGSSPSPPHAESARVTGVRYFRLRSSTAMRARGDLRSCDRGPSTVGLSAAAAFSGRCRRLGASRRVA